MLAPDHGLNIITEDHLTTGVAFRLQHIDGLVLIDGAETALGQLDANESAQHGGAVQTDDGIHRGIVDETGHQLISGGFGLAEAGLVIGDINVVVDVAVVGCKVTAGHTQRHISVATLQMLQIYHKGIPPVDEKSL